VVVIWEIFMFCKTKPRGRSMTHTETAAITAIAASAETIAITARFDPWAFGTPIAEPLTCGTFPELVSRFSRFSSARMSAALW